VIRKKGCRRRTPHSSGELGETTNEAGHTDDSIRDGDTASLAVVHREDEGGASEGEETTVEVIRSVHLRTSSRWGGGRYLQRARVADLPQRGRALHIGVGRERAMSATGAVVDAVRIRERTLVVSEVAHGGHG